MGPVGPTRGPKHAPPSHVPPPHPPPPTLAPTPDRPSAASGGVIHEGLGAGSVGLTCLLHVPLYRRLYRPSAYYVAKSLVQVPLAVLNVLVFCIVIYGQYHGRVLTIESRCIRAGQP